MTPETELLRDAADLARMCQMFRRVGGVIPGVKEMLDSLVSDADAILAKIDAAESVAEGFVMVPATPSNAMLDAGFDAQPEAGRDSLLCAWEAMLAASGRQQGGENKKENTNTHIRDKVLKEDAEIGNFRRPKKDEPNG